MSSSSLFFVDDLWVEDSIADDGDLAGLRVDTAEEATLVAFVAGRSADLIHFDQQRVGVAVEEKFFQLLNVAALFAFAPQLVPAAAEVDDSARLQRFLIGRLIHVGQHQNLAGRRILSDDGK